jgi:phosphate transport system substrate-binding protein
MSIGCKDFAEVKAVADDKARHAACVSVRKDGRSIDIDGDYTETLARIQSTPTGIGVFGLSFYEQNRDKVKVAPVSGVVPSVDAIATGKYPVSRPLFFYVKKAHVGAIPGLKEYVDFFLSDRMVGQEGATVDKGLIPMPAAELKAQREKFTKGQTVGS